MWSSSGRPGTSGRACSRRSDAASGSRRSSASRAGSPRRRYPKTSFAAADVSRDDLVPHLRGADCAIHLAWLIQPSRDRETLWRTNVQGSTRVFAAVAEAGVPALVYASSIGVYSPGARSNGSTRAGRARACRARWYAQHKAEVERRLDRFEQEHPDRRVVRLRPALIMKRGRGRVGAAALLRPVPAEPAREAGPAPARAAHPRRGRAGRALARRRRGVCARRRRPTLRGAFNVATEPELDGRRLAAAIGARAVTVPAGIARALAAATWRLRLQPTSPDWLDLALGVPLLDSTRAREELGWSADCTAPWRPPASCWRALAAGALERHAAAPRGDRMEEIRAGIGGRPV